MPLVSVIVPNYNHAKFLQQRLDSIFNQTFQGFEVILLDDKSTDESVTVLSEYALHPKVSSFIVNEINSGSPFKQWNKGVQLAKGEIIWIAESDDVADKNFLSTLLPMLEADTKLGLAYCQSYCYSDKNEVTGSWLHYTEDLDSQLFLKQFSMRGVEYVKKFLIHKNTIPNASAVLFKKKIFQLTDQADEKIRTCSDWLTWLKILMNADVCYEPQMLNYFRYHDNSVIATAKHSQHISYFELQSGLMRISFAEFLDNNIVNDITRQAIFQTNEDYIINDYGFDGLAKLQKGVWLEGLDNLSKAIFYKGFNFHFLNLVLKKIRKLI